MFRKIIFPMAYIGFISSMVMFIITNDMRFGFIATCLLMAMYHNAYNKPDKIFIKIEAPKDTTRQQEDMKDERDSDRD